MKSELLFTVDAHDRPIRSRDRHEVVAQALWRRASGGLVIDGPRQLVLCHQRSSTKDERPNLWVATFGGKNQKGEDSGDAAKRELLEEFGLKTKELRVLYFDRIKSEERRQFEYIFYVFVDSENTEFDLRDGEVSQFKWLPFKFVMKHLGFDPNWYEYGYEKDMLKLASEKWNMAKSNHDLLCSF